MEYVHYIYQLHPKKKDKESNSVDRFFQRF